MLSLVATILAQGYCPSITAESIDAGSMLVQNLTSAQISNTTVGTTLMSVMPAEYGYSDWVFDSQSNRVYGYEVEFKNAGVSTGGVDHSGNGSFRSVSTNYAAGGSFYGPLWNAGYPYGLNVVSFRQPGDPGADFEVLSPRDPTDPSMGRDPVIEVRANGIATADILANGAVTAGTQWSVSQGLAAFTCNGGSGAPCMSCGDPGLGCYVPIVAHMHNASKHGALTVEDAERDAGGGWGEQFITHQDTCRYANGPDPIGGANYTVRYATTAGDLVLLGASVEPYFGNGLLPACSTGTTKLTVDSGVGEGAIFWNHDEDQMVVCDPYRADGGYITVAHKAPVFLPGLFVNTTLAVGALPSTQLPPNELPEFDALHVTIGAAGSGSCGSAQISAHDSAGHTCFFPFPCNLDAGTYRIPEYNLDCLNGFIAGSYVTWAVDSVGGCTIPPFITGNITPEVQWR